jgi:hypothetical protein
MRKEKLIEKAIKYLKRRGSNFVENSISYIGIRQNEELPDGSKKDMHVIRFLSLFDDDQPGRLCYLFADAKTEKLEYLLTPHFFEAIIDEG